MNSKTSITFAALLLAGRSIAQQVPTPLASINVPYSTQLPEEIEPNAGPRGPAFGFNRCNSTTENQNSNCQTMFVNSIDDFCLWAPPTLDTIANTEAREVAWCTQPGHGTRVIPPGALTGVQWLVMPDYIQINGFLDQTKVNMPGDDEGGELDPHGADEAGNPIGGLVYSNAFSGNNNTFDQIHEWVNFMGGNQFCLKICKPTGRNPAQDCQHIYDRIGCSYNAPNAAQDKIFEVCDSEDQTFVGVYTTNGQTSTWFQPTAENIPLGTIPYTPTPAPSSNCQTMTSAQLYAAAASDTIFSSAAPTSAPAGSAPASGATGATGGAAGGSGGATSGPAGTSSRTSAGGAASPTSNGALGQSASVGVTLGFAALAAIVL